MLVFLLTLLLVLVCAYDFSVRSSRVWRMLSSQFPGEPALPLIGNALQLGTTSLDVQRNLLRIWKKYGRKNFRAMFGTEPMLYICEAEDTKIILGSNVEITKSDQHLRITREHFGDSLANATGERWRTMRKLLTPLFHFNLLDQYLEVANNEGNILINKLKQHVDKPAFNIQELISVCTLDVICNAVMGIDIKTQSKGGKGYEYLEESRKILPLYIKRFYSVWYRYDFIYKLSALAKEGRRIDEALHNSVNQIITERRESFEKNIKPMVSTTDNVTDFISKNRPKLTLVDVLLLSKMPNGTPIPNEYIREETNLMVFAGYDTTLSTICFALCNLAKYKDLQEKVFKEQLEIFGDDMARSATSEDLTRMKYLQRFVKESMRVYPTLAHYGRKIKSDLVLNDGKVIPTGTNIVFLVPGIHMNPDYFPDPEKFDPDRFLEPISIYTYIPFSAGPRNCIGMNFAWMTIRSVLSNIIRNYKISQDSPKDDPQPVNEFILKSMNGFKVKLAARKYT